MSRPYIYWDPSLNAALWTRQSEGPLIVTVDDVPTPLQLSRLEMFVALAMSPVLYDNPWTAYARSVEAAGGSGMEKGLAVTNQEWMPHNLSFVAPGPDPLTYSNFYSGKRHRYLNLGWRFLLRGWVGTMDQGSLTGEFRLKWADEIERLQFSTRAAWTGLVLGFFNIADDRQDHVLDILHGKREADSDWEFHAGWLDQPASPGVEVVDENTYTANSVNQSNVRIVISGSGSLWNITTQFYSGSWIDVDSYSIDFRSNMSPVSDEIGMMASVFPGVAKESLGGPYGDESMVWFSEIQVPQFEPWVPDVSEWYARDWEKHWEWLAGPISGYELPLKRPVTDLMHYPVGTTKEPIELRHSDPDLGICIRVGLDTVLFATGNADNRYCDLGSSMTLTEPLATCDENSFGYQAPFAFYARMKFENMESWSSHMIIVSFGNIRNLSPTLSDNGIGMWVDATGTPKKIRVRAYDGAWRVVGYSIDDESEINNVPIDLGFVWTGSRGESMGRENYELRIVLNGITVASKTFGPMSIGATEKMTIGALDLYPGFSGLIRSVAVYGDAVSDYDLMHAFDEINEPFSNPSYEYAASSGRPGEALDWRWLGYQSGFDWAEFNAQNPEYEQWRTAMEEFSAGWSGIENWVSYITDMTLAISLFNAEVTQYETTLEEFELWLIWNGLATVVGTPWRDDWTNIEPYEDTLGPGSGPTGFDSWYDYLNATNVMPLRIEEFGEAWDNEMFTTVSPGPVWHAGTTIDGVIYGAALNFPLTIYPDKNSMIVYSDIAGVILLNLNAGEYDDEVSLAAMIQAAWNLQVGSIGLVFDSWNDGSNAGITFGWDGTPGVNHETVFGCMEILKASDVRPYIGLRGLGYNGRYGIVKTLLSTIGSIPGVDGNEVILIDQWSFMKFEIVTDPYTGDHVLEYGYVEAVVDSWVSDPTVIERFTFEGWFGIGAAWKDEYLPSEIDDAMFDSATTDMEEFETAEWPEYIW